ncbi:MAG: hypothetical protein Q8P41_22995 [Pseudomonadota bacterium]|nr:hypothetical protein [Pseudomonadota bacterium]
MLATLALAGIAVAAPEREPVAWALAVTGKVLRNDGTWLDVGEGIEPGATLGLPAGAVVTVAHNGRVERWEGPGGVRVGVRDVRVEIAGTVARFPHVEPGLTTLSGDTVAAGDADQATSALGIPLTEAAWARQDGIDGGMLHVLYRDDLLRRLSAAGLDPDGVAKLGLSDALPGTRDEQVALVGRYLDLAGATPKAALVLEVPPTSAPTLDTGGGAGALARGVFAKKPHTLRITGELDKVRAYGQLVAELLRGRGAVVFALVVPYANTVDNVIARSARPADGVENLHNLLVRAGGLASEVRTIAFGYSQGAAVLREYLARYGDSDGLDYALPVATMGGVDGRGADGVWSGKVGPQRADGVAVLEVVHARDPARWIYGRTLLGLTPGLFNFLQEGRPRGDDLALHMGYHGSVTTPLPSAGNADLALRAGIHGYPMGYLAPLVDDLFAGRYAGAWARRGDWTFDTRAELTGAATGDFRTWKQDPRAVADGYLK